LDKESAGHPHL
jgi:hypothetical protein